MTAARLALAATRDGGFPLLSRVYRGNCHGAKLFPESMTRVIDRVTRYKQRMVHRRCLVPVMVGPKSGVRDTSCQFAADRRRWISGG